MTFIDLLALAMMEVDPNIGLGAEIIIKSTNIFDDDFGKKLTNAPTENYLEILSHLEEIEKLLNKEEK